MMSHGQHQPIEDVAAPFRVALERYIRLLAGSLETAGPVMGHCQGVAIPTPVGPGLHSFLGSTPKAVSAWRAIDQNCPHVRTANGRPHPKGSFVSTPGPRIGLMSNPVAAS